MKKLLLLGLLVLAAAPAFAAERPVVVELFTSLSCSDCPPADLLLASVRKRGPGVLALDLHVTYWNSLGWTDPYALPAVDQLQREYAEAPGGQVYTPEAVVDGRERFIGSDSSAMAAALDKARARIAAERGVPISLRRDAQAITIRIERGTGQGIVWLFGFDPDLTTPVSGGENAGASLREVNVVRSITRLGTWRGRRLQLNTRVPAGMKFAVILQKSDGTVVGAAST